MKQAQHINGGMNGLFRRAAFGLLPALLATIMLADRARAATTYWDGSDSTDWFNNNNWSAGAPQDGDVAIITNAGFGVLISGATPDLASLTVSNKTVTFTNWSTVLRATSVVIRSGATLTVPAAFTQAQMSNRVYIACTDFTLDDGATIDADGRGYAATNGPGKGASAGYAGGAGYGGRGGRGLIWENIFGYAGTVYGSIQQPTAPGSGGGQAGGIAGPGGGAVRIAAVGTVTVNGIVSASGSNATVLSGGGSGGAIYISCATFAGASTGLLRVNGGNGVVVAQGSGGGGGGRIAVDYQNTSGAPAVRYAAKRGASWSDYFGENCDHYAPANGTLYLSDTAALSSNIPAGRFTGARLFLGTDSWSVASLTLNDNSLVLANDAFSLNVAGNVVIDSGGDLGVGDYGTGSNYALVCGGDLIVTNGGNLRVYSGATNNTVDYGAMVDVTGDLTVASSSWVYPYAHPTNGGAPLFRAANVYVLNGGGFNAVDKGYAAQAGPGKGAATTYGSGAGYGGDGGESYNGEGGIAYGSVSRPIAPGSGGGRGGDETSRGGGTIRIEANGTVALYGTLTADAGDEPTSNARGGGGSGGGIYVRCAALEGSATGLLSADGGNPQSQPLNGAGGGGRIALIYDSLASGWPDLRFSTAGGTGMAEYAGSPDDRWQYAAQWGSVYLSDTSALSAVLDGGQFTDVNLYVSGLTAWAVSDLTVSNNSVSLANESLTVNVANALRIENATFGLARINNTSNSALTVGGNLSLTNAAKFYVYSGMTNGTGLDYGARVTVTGNVLLASGCWIYPTSHDTDGGSALFDIGGMTIASNGGFNAAGRGYPAGAGPKPGTFGSYGGGGGHGGRGGDSFNGLGGGVYGVTNAPIAPGSGGGNALKGGRGGGVVRIDANGDITVRGTITANGGYVRPTDSLGGGGAGGAIFIRTQNNFIGPTNASLLAKGANAFDLNWSGGGGGGRIAVWHNAPRGEWPGILAGTAVYLVSTNGSDDYVGTLSVTNGSGSSNLAEPYRAKPGSCVFISQISPAGTVIKIW